MKRAKEIFLRQSRKKYNQTMQRLSDILGIDFTTRKVSKYGVFFGRHFPAFGLNTERYFVSLCIHSECGKIWTRKNSVFGHISHSVSFTIHKEGLDFYYNINFAYKLPHELPNDSRLGILGN